MPKFGDRRRGKLISPTHSPNTLFIWLACDKCGKGRWVSPYKIGKVCKNCRRKYFTVEELLRLNSCVNPLTGCVEWTGWRDKDGYGRYVFNRVKITAHRASYELNFGKVPKGLFVLHKCDNPPCFNPDHLFIGTIQDNVDDMKKKGRAPNFKGEKNPQAKLTSENVIFIRNSELCPSDLAKMFGVSFATIYDAIKGRTWKHLNA
jgi:hypothetical protein